MRHPLTCGEWIQILEHHNLPMFNIEINALKRTDTYKESVLEFETWFFAMSPMAQYQMLLIGLTPENWSRYHNWNMMHLNDRQFCKMLFPLCEASEALEQTRLIAESNEEEN